MKNRPKGWFIKEVVKENPEVLEILEPKQLIVVAHYYGLTVHGMHYVTLTLAQIGARYQMGSRQNVHRIKARSEKKISDWLKERDINPQ